MEYTIIQGHGKTIVSDGSKKIELKNSFIKKMYWGDIIQYLKDKGI